MESEPIGASAPTEDTPPSVSGEPEFITVNVTDGPKIGDTKPRQSKRKTRASKNRTTAEIEKALAELLTMPSIPFTLSGDEFCASHFMEAGPDLAQKLAVTSEHNETLRRILERMVDGESVAVLFMGFTMYLLPPMIHHGLIPGSREIAPLFNVPMSDDHNHGLHSVPDGSN